MEVILQVMDRDHPHTFKIRSPCELHPKGELIAYESNNFIYKKLFTQVHISFLVERSLEFVVFKSFITYKP